MVSLEGEVGEVAVEAMRPPSLFPQEENDRRRRHIRKRRRACCVFLSLWLILSMLVALGAIIYYPESPQMHICNSRFDWGHLHGVSKCQHTWRFRAPCSHHNPNHFGLKVSNIRVDFFHRNERVGAFETSKDSFTVPGGSIGDSYVSVDFVPSAAQALSLLSDYKAGKLVLGLEGVADIEVLLLNASIFKTEYHIRSI